MFLDKFEIEIELIFIEILLGVLDGDLFGPDWAPLNDPWHFIAFMELNLTHFMR